MKKFNFKLESVLKVRGIRKKIIEKEVSRIQSKLNKVIDETTQVRTKTEQSFHFNAPRSDLTFWMEMCGTYRAGLKQRELALKEQKERLDSKLRVEKKKLISKLKDEKVMTTLKESKYQQFLFNADKEEQKEIEEIDILKRGKKQ